MTLTLPSDTEILMVREFDAPRDLVYEAHVKPEHLKRWWGPRGSELSVCEVDLRPGGAYRFVMQFPDGKEEPFKGVFREITPPERLAYTFIYDVAPFDEFPATETVTFEDLGGRTRVSSLMVCMSKEARDGMVESGMEEGAAESLDRLEDLLGALR